MGSYTNQHPNHGVGESSGGEGQADDQADDQAAPCGALDIDFDGRGAEIPQSYEEPKNGILSL
jgi:hypothetical protein